MAAKKKKRKQRLRAKWHLGGSKAKLSRSRGHKPVALLQLYREKMEHNLVKLDRKIATRKAAGE